MLNIKDKAVTRLISLSVSQVQSEKLAAIQALGRAGRVLTPN